MELLRDENVNIQHSILRYCIITTLGECLSRYPMSRFLDPDIRCPIFRYSDIRDPNIPILRYAENPILWIPMEIPVSDIQISDIRCPISIIPISNTQHSCIQCSPIFRNSDIRYPDIHIFRYPISRNSGVLVSR